MRQNRRFVGREDTLDRLKDMMFDQGNQRVALVGLGGIGKTQVALELAQWTAQHKPDHSIFWVPALSNATFEQAYVEMATMLPVQRKGQDEDPKELVRRYLSSNGAGRWLLILDNADDVGMASILKQYLPESNQGIILVTTRSPDMALSVAEGITVQLGQMSLQEAKDMLQKWLSFKSPEDNAAVEDLLRELAYLPLAITQAAAYLTRNRMPIARYLGLLRRTEKDLVDVLSREFHDSTRYDGSQNAVATTWLVSFDQIRKSDSAAAELLSFISHIEPKAIPQSMLPRQGSEEQTEYAIGTLCGYAFLGRRGQSEVFDMHSLVHVATRIWVERVWTERHERVGMTQVEAVGHVSVIFPTTDRANSERWRIYLPHATRLLESSSGWQSEERYHLLREVGLCLYTDRRFKEAIRYLDKVCEWKRGNLNEKDHDRLTSEYELASAYLDDRRIKEAISIFEHVVAVKKRTQAEEDYNRLTSEHELARAYLNDRRIKEAISIFEHVVAVRKRTLAEEDYNLLMSEHELARAYLNDRRIKEAISIFEYVVVVQKRTLVEEDHSRLTSEHELARAYLDDRRIKEAISIFEHVVAVRKRTLAEEDYNLLMSEHELARAYLNDRRIKEAISIFEHVVAVQKRTLAEEDYSRLTSEYELARAYLDDRRIKEAISIFEHVVAVWKRTLAEEDHSRLASEECLACAREMNITAIVH